MTMVLQGKPYNPSESMMMEGEPLKGKRNLEFLESGYTSHTPDVSTEEGKPQTVKGITYSFEGKIHCKSVMFWEKIYCNPSAIIPWGTEV